ncbi:MAG: DoxX family protein [Candidatus Marinimicrobia bacterium]|nr:DoxX family protein [Candidatus Neomarinimicrobiota bacterium]
MIVFIQSGLDKIIDKKGNLDWLRDHFSKTFLKSIVPHLLLVLTLLEFISGILFFVGILFYFFKAQTQLIVFGLILSNITILCLFLGQRIAKDYVGAADLVNYFTLSIIGLLVFLY